MSKRLALKAGLQLLYDNRPSFIQLDTGLAAPDDTFYLERDDLDAILTVSLVVNVK